MFRQFFTDWWRGNLLGARSSKWEEVRAGFLKKYPVCAACGSKRGLNVHHITPFNVDKSLELVENNFITLCGWLGNNCHLRFGHLFNFRSWNTDVRRDAEIWRSKIENRP